MVKAVENGVKIYDPNKITALSTDWRKTGMGFMLMQKNCMCEMVTPICCPGGWTLVYAGLSFTSSAELRYSPVEGECSSMGTKEDKALYTWGSLTISGRGSQATPEDSG